MIFKIDQLIKLYEMIIKEMDTEMGTTPEITILLQNIKSFGNTINRTDLESFCECLCDRFPDLAYTTSQLLEQTRDRGNVILSDKYIKTLTTLTINHKKNARLFEK